MNGSWGGKWIFLFGVLFALPVFADTMVYFPTGSGNSVDIVDATHDRVIGSIGGVTNAHGLAATPDGALLVVGSLTERPAGAALPKPSEMSEAEHRSHHSMSENSATQGPNTGTLYLIDTKKRRVVHQIAVPGAVHHVAVTPDGHYAISTHPGRGGISVVDLRQRKLVRTIATGPVPNYAVVSRDGSRIYVSNAANNTVSEIDTVHWFVLRNMMVGKTPEHMALSPDERTLYVANVAAGTISAIDLQRGVVSKTYPIGPEPHGVALSRDGKRLFATSRGGDRLVAINLVSGEQTTLRLAPAPYHIAVIRGLHKLYVSSAKQPKLWVVSEDSLKVKGEIKFQGEGHQMAVIAK